MRWIINFFKALFGICDTKPLQADLWSVEENKITINLDEMPELCEKGKGIYLKGKGLKRPVLIVRTEADSYLAYTNRCTHMGHRKLDPVAGPDPGQPVLRCCSLNHSTFDYEGNRITGPAKDPLVKHEVGLSEGKLVVTLTVPVEEEAPSEVAAPDEAPASAPTAEPEATEEEKPSPLP